MRVMKRTAYVQGTHFVSSNGTDPQDMFNNTVSDTTTRAGDLTVVLTPGLIGGIGFAGLVGTDLSVVGTSDSVEVFRHEQSLSDELISDWFEYFFESFDQITDVFVDDIPPYGDIELTITIEGTSTACGVCAFGRVFEFGSVEQGASVQFLDYSTKETDATTGVTTFDEGPFSKRLGATVFVPIGQINRMQRVLAESRATPTFWSLVSGSTFDEVVTVFGFYRDFSIVIAYPTNFLCSLDIEGLI